MTFKGIHTHQTTKHLALVPDQCDQLIQTLTVQARGNKGSYNVQAQNHSLWLSVQGITDNMEDKDREGSEDLLKKTDTVQRAHFSVVMDIKW